MTKLHTERFPEFMRELDGIAAGAQVPFSKVRLCVQQEAHSQRNCFARHKQRCS